MNKRVLSCSYLGAQSFLIEVEIDISTGLPIFSIIGLGDTAISESKDRIKTALKNSNFPLIPKKIIVNLSPAERELTLIYLFLLELWLLWGL